MSNPVPFAAALAAEVRPSAPAPWWKFGMVWFMLSGPALVVVAGFATLAIALKYPDVELHQAPTLAVPVAAKSTDLPNRSATWQPGEAATLSGH